MKETEHMNDIKLSDTHLRVINRALEVYFRMRSGQVGIALGQLPYWLAFADLVGLMVGLALTTALVLFLAIPAWHGE